MPEDTDLSEYDPDAFEEMAESVDSGGPVTTGEINRVAVTTAGEAFGPDAMQEPDDPLIEVRAFVPEEDVEVTDYFSPPKGPRSFAHPDFKLGKFKRRYDQVPVVGMTVDIGVDENGFYEILL